MKRFPAIDRYVARLTIMPMLAVFVIAASLLVLDKMNKLFDFVATEGGPVSVVFKMLANLLPEYASLAIPLGLMLGILLAFRKLATSSELDVMRAVGLSYTRLLRVPYMLTLGLMVVNFLIVSYLQPLSRYYYEPLQFELRSGALGASIKVGEFTHLGDRMTLRIEESRENGRDLSGIFVHANTSKGDWIGVTAERGRFLATDDPNVIIFRLTNGTLIHNRPEFKAPRVLTFSSHDLPIDLPKFDNFRQRGGRDLEFTLPELAKLGQDARSAEARAGSRSEFHFRVVEVVTMFLLPLLAVSLGIPPKRSTSALGVFLSIVMLVTYFKVNQYAADIGALGKVDPLLALWAPFAVFAGLVLWMYYVTAYVPGGQPIGALERGVAKLVKAIGRWLPGRRRKKAYTA